MKLITPAQNITKEKILFIAEHLFITEGYYCTSIRKISIEAGANIAMVNYYFQSKENLLFTIIDLRLSSFSKEINKSIRVTDNPSNKILNYINANLKIVFKHRQFFIFIMREEHGDIPLNSRNLISNYLHSMHIFLENNVSDLIKNFQNDNATEFDVEMFCFSVLSTFIHTIISNKFGEGQSEKIKMARLKHFFKVYLNNMFLIYGI